MPTSRLSSTLRFSAVLFNRQTFLSAQALQSLASLHERNNASKRNGVYNAIIFVVIATLCYI